MPKDTKTLGNSKARACESLGFVHKKGCARVLTQPLKNKNDDVLIVSKNESLYTRSYFYTKSAIR